MMSKLLWQKEEMPFPAATTLGVCVERNLSSIALLLSWIQLQVLLFQHVFVCLSLSILQLRGQGLGLPTQNCGCLSEDCCWHCGLDQMEEGERELMIM